MQLQTATSLVLALLLTGCIVFPVSRTYFEPNPNDGTPVPSRSCGYNRAANDSLERNFAGLLFQVSPDFVENQPLMVTFFVRFNQSEVTLLPERWELHSLPDGNVYTGTVVNTTQRQENGYQVRWTTLRYEVAGSDLTNIELVFPVGSVRTDSEDILLAPFRFSKVTKSDIFYGSINC